MDDGKKPRGDCPCCGQALPEFDVPRVDQERGLVIYGRLAAPLTREMLALFTTLNDAWPRIATKQQLFDGNYWLRAERETPDMKIVDVWICKLRRILKPLGIAIETSWGQGYSLRLPVKRKDAA